MADKDLYRDGLENSAEGKAKDLKGRVKDAAGGLTGDTGLQAEGKLDRLEGKVQDTVGKVERDIDRELDRNNPRRIDHEPESDV